MAFADPLAKGLVDPRLPSRTALLEMVKYGVDAAQVRFRMHVASTAEGTAARIVPLEAHPRAHSFRARPKRGVLVAGARFAILMGTADTNPVQPAATGAIMFEEAREQLTQLEDKLGQLRRRL